MNEVRTNNLIITINIICFSFRSLPSFLVHLQLFPAFELLQQQHIYGNNFFCFSVQY